MFDYDIHFVISIMNCQKQTDQGNGNPMSMMYNLG